MHFFPFRGSYRPRRAADPTGPNSSDAGGVSELIPSPLNSSPWPRLYTRKEGRCYTENNRCRLLRFSSRWEGNSFLSLGGGRTVTQETG